MFFIFHYLKLEKFETIDFNEKGAYAKNSETSFWPVCYYNDLVQII